MRNDQLHRIPNDIKTAEAFFPSISKSWVAKNRYVKQELVDTYVDTSELIRSFQTEGWEINGGFEKRNKRNHKIEHFIKMTQPDYAFGRGKCKTEASIFIQGNSSPFVDTQVDVGATRLVCANGLIRRDIDKEHSFSPFQMQHISLYVEQLKDAANQTLENFKAAQFVELEASEIEYYAKTARTLHPERGRFGALDLLTVRRPEDEGNSKWNVYNRIQENLTKPNMLVDANGRPIMGLNLRQNVSVNNGLAHLFQL